MTSPEISVWMAIMLKIPDKIFHRHQETCYSCGAAAMAMLFGWPEEKMREALKTTKGGTSEYNVTKFLDINNISYHYVSIEKNYFESISNLILLSCKYPFYIASLYTSKGKGRGRPRVRRHAAVFCDGQIYDPGENTVLDGEAYLATFNKNLTFNYIIIIEQERPNFIKNFNKYSF